MKKMWVHVDVEIEVVEKWVPLRLDIRNLELHSSFFKITMISMPKVAMTLPWSSIRCPNLGANF